MLKLLDLFSGIGGFSLGMEATKQIKTIGFVEKDKFCQKVLRKNFKNVPIGEDIRNVKGSNYTADIISGGFPCQPFSVAGKRKGTEDDRYLWDEMLRVITEVKPRWVIGENVQGIINIEEGMVLRQVQNDLDSEGFKVQCFIIPASGIGAWHNRNRVWILACNISNTNSIRHRRGNSTRCADEEWTFLPREQEGGKMGSKTERRSNVSDTCIKRPQGYRLSTNVEEKQRREDLSTKTSAEEQQTWWQTQSKICGVPNGVSYGVDRDRAKRIKALANSICPQIARQIGLAIMEAENDN